jgi:UDP-N-acetyl-alpha-D-quinovosamine dehydrogenase
MPSSHRLSRQLLVTGATGFLGVVIADVLERDGYAVSRGAREIPRDAPCSGRWTAYGDIGPDTEWRSALEGVDGVIHLAGVAHVPDRPDGDVVRLLDRVNVGGTERLAQAAAANHVRRFIHVSTAVVHGSYGHAGPISEASPLCPSDLYAESKLKSEQRLRNVAASTRMEIVILRPPMVYGPGAKANFKRLVRLVQAGIPLPLGAATAPRSFIGVANLAHAVAACLEHPSAAGETFLVRDGETSSTTDLIEKIGLALERRVTNVSMPPALVRAALRVVGRSRDFDKLFGAFEIDSKHIETRLGWRAPVSLVEGLRQALGRDQAGRADR